MICLGGIGLTWLTADHGGQLVYQHGAGVQAVSAETPVFVAADSSASAGPVMNDQGGEPSNPPERPHGWKA